MHIKHEGLDGKREILYLREFAAITHNEGLDGTGEILYL